MKSARINFRRRRAGAARPIEQVGKKPGVWPCNTDTRRRCGTR